ncbi:MAG: rubredoxin-like domain-containing protein [Smithella sp.]
MKHKASAVQKEKNSKKKVSGKTGWRCEACGHIHYGDEPLDECPFCTYPNHAFTKVGQQE